MPLTLPSLSRFRLARPGGRLQHVLLWTAVAVGFALLVAYQSWVTVTEQQPPVMMRALSDLAVAAWGGLLGWLVARMLVARQVHPVRALWVPLVVAAVGLVAAGILVAAQGGPTEVDPEVGLPGGFGGAFQVSALALIEVAVAAVLLFALRSLVLFKRTTASVRNWRLMLGLMVAAALVLVGNGPLDGVEGFIPHVVLLVLAVLFMIANAFRLSWIVYLPTRQKLATAALAVGLIAALSVFLNNRGSTGWMGALVYEGGSRMGDGHVIPLSALFSQPLSQFVTVAFAFGVLYAVTALLSLLFHLPTAGALQQKTGELEAMGALARLSGEVFDRDRLVDTIAGAPVEAGVAQAAWLAVIEPETGSLRPKLAAAHGLTPTQIRALTDFEALATAALGGDGPLLLREAPADHRVRARPGDGVGTLLVLPLRAHEDALGALFATRAVSEGFEDDDVAALQTFAGQAALALNNADLFAERIERERLERELTIAREVQQKLLPQQLPGAAGGPFHLAALSLPAMEVAGDYYDVVDLGDGCYGIIVADVAGKGTSAAFYMAELKGIFQSVSRLTRSPREFLIRANEALSGSLGRQAFISAVYGVLDSEAGRFTLARAGHCPVAFARAGSGGGAPEVRLLRSPGLGLGLDRGPLFGQALREETTELRPGDTFVLYTDGLVETRDAAGEEYGYERLAEALGRHSHLGPEALRDVLLRELRRFVHPHGSNEPDSWDDDLTLVVLSWNGAEAAEATAAAADRDAPPPARATA